MVSPPARRAAARELHEKHDVSVRRACDLVGVTRSSLSDRPHRRPDEQGLTDRIHELAKRNTRYGYRRITPLLRREGWLVNGKRVHRIWKAEGLSLLRRRKWRRRGSSTAEVLEKAAYRDHVWSYDFLEDRTERGGRLRILVVLDEYTRECLAAVVAPSISSTQVIQALEWLFLTRGVPSFIRSDNGPEFTAKATRAWLAREGCQTLFIEPGSPWENPYIESFIGKLRDECLNLEVFRNGREAQKIVENWIEEYNHYRPHSSLGYQTPVEFATRNGNSGRPTGSRRFHSVHSEN